MPGRKSEKEAPAGEGGALSWIRPSLGRQRVEEGEEEDACSVDQRQ